MACLAFPSPEGTVFLDAICVVLVSWLLAFPARRCSDYMVKIPLTKRVGFCPPPPGFLIHVTHYRWFDICLSRLVPLASPGPSTPPVRRPLCLNGPTLSFTAAPAGALPPSSPPSQACVRDGAFFCVVFSFTFVLKLGTHMIDRSGVFEARREECLSLVSPPFLILLWPP